MEFNIKCRNAPVIYEESLSSTNTVLKELARSGAAHGTVLIARCQTGGRGRMGRSFQSPPEGLYMSMLLRTKIAPEKTASITPMAAVAVCRTAERQAGVSPDIKWPNDVLLGGKKLCGILTEMSADGSGGAQLILGIGVNVNTPAAAFSPELREIVCSLLSHTGHRTDIAAFAEGLIRELDALYSAWVEDSQAFLAEYRRRCSTVGRDILILQNGESRPARAVGINGDMSLRVISARGEEDLRFGEVSVIARK